MCAGKTATNIQMHIDLTGSCFFPPSLVQCTLAKILYVTSSLQPPFVTQMAHTSNRIATVNRMSGRHCAWKYVTMKRIVSEMPPKKKISSLKLFFSLSLNGLSQHFYLKLWLCILYFSRHWKIYTQHQFNTDQYSKKMRNCIMLILISSWRKHEE